MIYNNLNNNSVSMMGIGLMRHNPNDFEKTQQIIDTAMSQGVNYFESCYFYLNNQCEQILAKALSKYNREDYYLCGKMPVHNILEKYTPEEIFKQQLKNNNTNYFDYYLIQAVDKKGIKIIQNSNLIPFLNEQKGKGRIKHLGFSFHDLPQVLEQFIKINDWDLVQLQLNYYDWYFSTGQENYQIVKDYKLPIVVMGGLKGGLLGDKMPIECNANSIELAYKFLSVLSNVKVILSGAETLEQTQLNINFFKDKTKCILKKWELAIITDIINKLRKCSLISCTGCGYCMRDCPVNIPVKDIFSLYNKIILNSKENLKEYVDIQKSKFSSFSCLGCGNCEKLCPQHLPIRKLFNENIFQLRM